MPRKESLSDHSQAGRGVRWSRCLIERVKKTRQRASPPKRFVPEPEQSKNQHAFLLTSLNVWYPLGETLTCPPEKVMSAYAPWI